MYYPPESANYRYHIRFFIIPYFLSERLRPDTPPTAFIYYFEFSHLFNVAL